MKLNLRQTKNKLNFMLWGYKIEDGKLIFNDKIENITLKSSTKVHCVQLKNSMKEQVKEIVLPKNLKEIEPELFKDFTFLEKITFNENLEVIGKSAFEGCVSLKEIKLPNKVKEIGESAFSNCKSLKNVELPSSIESIGADCFSCCTKLKTAILDKCNIETIPYRCFYRSGLKTIKLPSNLKEIDREAFTKTKIDKIKFPNSLVSIGAKAFANCESLLEIDLQNTQIEVLNYDTFYADLKLDKVILPETLKKIGTGVFYKTSIQTIELPQSVECIGESCFAQCDKLEQITLPQNIKTIKSCVFSRCINLKNIDLSNTNLQMIALGAFLNCKSLMQIKLPKTIERLDEQVFYKSGITSIDLSETKVEFIGHCCFEDCVNLEKIVLSDSLKCIGHKAFKSCPITSITLPSTLKDIQYDAFTSCNKLESIDLSNCEISTITNNMFNNCTSLKEVRLPQKLTTIGKNAFENTAISEMEFPASLRYICEQAFIDCKNLTQIDLSNTDLTTIESKAFKGCTSLKYAKLSPFLKELNNDTFEQQTILELYTLPYKEEIMEDTFSSFEYYHSHIRHYNIPSLKSMPNTIILHLGQLKTEKEKKNNSFNFNEFIKSTLSSNTQPHTYIQINDTDIIVTNDKTNLIPKISYYFYPILRKNTYWENNLNNYKFYDDLIKYEIPLPKDTLRYFNEIYSGDTTPNFSKFKRVSNIIEHIYATTNIAIENLNDFYRLAINLGAFSQDEQTRTTVCNFLKDKLIRGELNLFTMHQDYDSMKLKGEKKGFTEFYIKNFTALNQKGAHFICDAYNNFKSYQRWHTSNRGNQRQLKPSIESLEAYFEEKKVNVFICANEEQKNIAKEISQFFTGVKTFEIACDIMEEFKVANIAKSLVKDTNAILDLSAINNTSENFSNIAVNNSAQTQTTTQQGNKTPSQKPIYTYKWLDKDDVRNLTLGKYCNCCAHLEGAGFGIMRASIICPNVQNLVILKDNKIVAKSTLYINKEKCYGVFNNVEVSKKMTSKDETEIYNSYIKGVQAFITQYNKENPNAQLKQVNVGLHLNDLFTYFADDKSDNTLQSLNYGAYSLDNIWTYTGDAMREEGQACLYKQKTKLKNAEIEK